MSCVLPKRPADARLAPASRNSQQVRDVKTTNTLTPQNKPREEELTAACQPRRALDLSVPPSVLAKLGAQELAQVAASRLPSLGFEAPEPQQGTQTVEHNRTIALNGGSTDPDTGATTTLDVSATRFDSDGPRQASVQLEHTRGGLTAEAHANNDRDYSAGVGGSVTYQHENGAKLGASLEHQPLFARTQARVSVGTETAAVSAIAEFDDDGKHVGTGAALSGTAGEHSAEVAVIAKLDGTTRLDAAYTTPAVELSGSVVLDARGKPVGDAWAYVKVQPSEDTRLLAGVTHNFDEQTTSGVVGVEHQLNEAVRVDVSGSVGEDDQRVMVGVNVRF